ncbi:hypothetical protein HY604_02220 [Candidatus Peregrinibacteria bacterium]|nr:hypothetical protein [Candidatus Peregrinibacteria bacterium]
MKKMMFLLLILPLLFAACTKPETEESDKYDPNRDAVKNTQVELSLAALALTDAGEGSDAESKMDFVIYLERPDLNLKQPLQDRENESVYTQDLPLELQPRLMYVSDVSDTDRDSGSMCYRQIFPHACTVNLKREDFEKGELTYLIKILFEDDTYAAKEITVKIPQRLAKPELIEPMQAPKQGNTLAMKFKDVGADDYEIAVNLCRPYGDDGINPCLDGVNYSLKRKDGVLLDATYQPLYPIKIEKDRDIISLTSDFVISFEESVEYSIIAKKLGEVDEKIPAITTSYELKNFGI